MADADDRFTFDLIQEITRLDGSRYYELGNVLMNGRAEKAVIKGFIQRVRIVMLNVPHSTAVKTYEDYINATYTLPPVALTQWEEWAKPEGPIKVAFEQVLAQNHVH